MKKKRNHIEVHIITQYKFSYPIKENMQNYYHMKEASFSIGAIASYQKA